MCYIYHWNDLGSNKDFADILPEFLVNTYYLILKRAIFAKLWQKWFLEVHRLLGICFFISGVGPDLFTKQIYRGFSKFVTKVDC